MTPRLHTAIAALTVVGAAGVVLAGPVSADPADPAPPPTTVVETPPPPPPPAPALVQTDPMTPRQLAVPPAVPSGDPATAPPAAPNFQPSVPEIPNAQYGSGKYGSGVMGTLRDLWDQAKNPNFAQDQIMGGTGAGATAPQPGAQPAAPPPAAGNGSQSGPALPPGYYPIDGPPPPGYQFLAPGQAAPPLVTPVPTP
ncbi:MAG: hypothetical protein ACR2JM_12280 [Mycobacterium sp.]